MISRSQNSAGPILGIFSPNESVLGENDRSGPLFDSSMAVAMATNLNKRKIYFVTLPFGNGLRYCNCDFKRLDRMNISTSCTILVTFGPETLEFICC